MYLENGANGQQGHVSRSLPPWPPEKEGLRRGAPGQGVVPVAPGGSGLIAIALKVHEPVMAGSPSLVPPWRRTRIRSDALHESRT